MIEEITIIEPTLGTVKDAITKLKNEKAPGINNITTSLPKADVWFSTERMHQLLKKM